MTNLQKQVQTLYKNYPEMPYISPNRPLKEWLDGLDIGKSHLVAKRQMERFPNGLLPGDLILLWHISLGTFTTDSWYPKYFEYDYGINGPQSLDQLVDQGFARQMTAKESLTYQTAPQLKQLLKQKNVKGYSKLKKDELIQEVKEHFDDATLDQTISLRGYALTPKGEQALKDYPEPVERHPKNSL